MPYLTETIKSGKGRIYGVVGDEVTIVTDRYDHMRIVEHVKTKERFSLTIKQLTDAQTTKKQEQEVLPEQNDKRTGNKIRRAKTYNIPADGQPTLF